MWQNLLMQCEDPQCHVWQHIRCVIIPEKPTDGISPDLPPRFYCEICRVNRADPYVFLDLVLILLVVWLSIIISGPFRINITVRKLFFFCIVPSCLWFWSFLYVNLLDDMLFYLMMFLKHFVIIFWAFVLKSTW